MKSIINRIYSCTDQWFSKLGYTIAVVTILWPARALATTGVGTLPWDAPLATIQAIGGTLASGRGVTPEISRKYGRFAVGPSGGLDSDPSVACPVDPAERTGTFEVHPSDG